MPRVSIIEGDRSSMHPCHVTAKPAKDADERVRRQEPPGLYPVGSPGGDGKPLWQCLHSSEELLSPFTWSTARWAGPISCWEKIGARPSPSAKVAEKSGPLFAGMRSDIGIDVAAADEFQGEYPLHRVFHDQELHHALRLTGGELGKASALLWSIKEAVVKALGCAFHLVAPLQVHVSPSVAGEDGGYTFPVCLSGKALMRYPMGAGRSIWVRSFPQEKMWLSIALLSWQSR